MNIADVEREVLDLAVDDYVDLWEVWGIFAENSSSSPARIAEQAYEVMRHLFDDELLEFYTKSFPVEDLEISNNIFDRFDLRDPRQWEVPAAGETAIVLTATAKGEDAYYNLASKGSDS